MTTGRKLIEAIAAERSRQTDKYDPLIANTRAIAPLVNERLAEIEDANEKYHQDDLRDFEERTYPSPGDAQHKET